MPIEQTPVISFRNAVPRDVDEAIPLIYSSGPAAFDYIFDVPGKGSAQDFVRYCFQKRSGEMAHTDHVVALMDDRIVGIGKGYGSSRNFRNTLSIAWNILLFYGLIQAIGVIRRGLEFEKMVKPPAKGELTIVHIGVRPDSQGRGIGRKIMKHLVRKARVSGYEKAVLDVAEKNDRARLLYEDLGFRVEKHYPSEIKLRTSYEPVPGHYRMALGVVST